MANWLFPMKDITINIDKWSPGNPLWITGSIGDGKSTLASQLAKEYNAEIISSDIVLCRMMWSIDRFNKFMNGGSDITAEVHMISTNSSPAWNYVNQHPELPYGIKNTGTKSDELRMNMIKFYAWLMDELIKPEYDNNLYIIEGSDILFMNPFEMMDKPLIIKGGCRIRSLWRRSKRNTKKKGYGMIISIYKYIKKYPETAAIIDSTKENFIKVIKKL